MRSVAVYCGARAGQDPAFAAGLSLLGRRIAERGLSLVFGGGRVGLMGVVADAALAAGGEVIGVIPRAMVERELGHTALSRLELVDSMHQRKARMAELADAFIAAPGGYGTLDELFEALTWTQLGLQHKPSGLFDLQGYYRDLASFLDRAVAEDFVDARHRQTLLCEGDPDALLDALAAWVSPGPRRELAGGWKTVEA
jgi:uncharacterized protein (TIGR00730 family)